ncbi:P-loop containing nucleoside triphosphate hydrolase protein [Catenaria anguillulae PL171]|uniref:p-loop containing nucleoside triphosphate hydrolase protein n=1 Tax=Catenaria anguillulae PL171 TaxID=765915 RepID=A0A1Y2HXY9_9FUNG|nr:P-loop containing nucleoside triphosphate hydrolase protein [Catenaria anguillulae PL171]
MATFTSTRLSKAELLEAQQLFQATQTPGAETKLPPAKRSTFEVYARVRPLLPTEPQQTIPGLVVDTQLAHANSPDPSSKGTVAALHNPPGRTFIDGFQGVFGTTAPTAQVFASSIEKNLDTALQGGTLSVFCYGYTGAGKTHTMLGSTTDKGFEPGLYSLLTENLLARLAPGLSLHVRFIELYNKKVFDLLDDRQECHLRNNSNGDLLVRGQVQLLDDGRVYAMNQRSALVTSKDDASRVLAAGLAHRALGSSSLNNQSSRSHGVLELEIVNDDLIQARKEVAEAEAREIPLGKDVIDRKIGFWTNAGLIRLNGHDIVLTCDEDDSIAVSDWMDRFRKEVNEIQEAERKAHVAKLAHDEAQAREREIVAQAAGAIGGMVTLVDLAGADKDDRDIAKSGATKEEKIESMYINKSLMALRQCITAIATKQGRAPFRDTTLTRILKPVLDPSSPRSTAAVMIVNVSPSVVPVQAPEQPARSGRPAHCPLQVPVHAPEQPARSGRPEHCPLHVPVQAPEQPARSGRPEHCPLHVPVQVPEQPASICCFLFAAAEQLCEQEWYGS